MADRSRWDYGERDRDDRDLTDDYGRSNYGGYRGRGEYSGNLRSDDDRTMRDIAGFRGTGYLGGDYGQARLGRNDYERETISYRGRGPKNYQRSDDRIREDVCERLERDHHVDASDIEVKVSGGVVTLSGSVNDRDMKRRAEDLAESCGGVSDVQNQIRVARRESS